MSKKEKNKPEDLVEISGGYMAVDRDKAIQANMDLIKNLAKNLPEKSEEKPLKPKK
jgi:hypothetical protein